MNIAGPRNQRYLQPGLLETGLLVLGDGEEFGELADKVNNRRFMHAGMGNVPGDPRYGLRTTLAGPMRTGRYFDPNARAPDLMLTD